MLRSALFAIGLIASCGQAAYSQGADAFPPRQATDEDAKILASPDKAIVREELTRMGLHQIPGKTCTAFITADSIRTIETPLRLQGAVVTLPYASFLIWSPDRPFAQAVLYHLFGPKDAAYRQPQVLPPPDEGSSSRTVQVILAPRTPYPSAAAVSADRTALAAGPFFDEGGTGKVQRVSVRPYVIPTEVDDPAQPLPRKDAHTLSVTCLSDPARAKNCLCAATEP